MTTLEDRFLDIDTAAGVLRSTLIFWPDEFRESRNRQAALELIDNDPLVMMHYGTIQLDHGDIDYYITSDVPLLYQAWEKTRGLCTVAAGLIPERLQSTELFRAVGSSTEDESLIRRWLLAVHMIAAPTLSFWLVNHNQLTALGQTERTHLCRSLRDGRFPGLPAMSEVRPLGAACARVVATMKPQADPVEAGRGTIKGGRKRIPIEEKLELEREFRRGRVAGKWQSQDEFAATKRMTKSTVSNWLRAAREHRRVSKQRPRN